MMKRQSERQPNGYLETIQKGVAGARAFSAGFSRGSLTEEERMQRLKRELACADAVIIGAGAGLSTSAGFSYSGARFEKYFFDFAAKFGIRDMYSGGFYPFPEEEIRWAWWARHIYYNRYVDAPKPVYKKLLSLVGDKDYFVITTNVDHQFQKNGFDKKRLFYTQGDYGLFQEVGGKSRLTFDNEAWVLRAMEAQGFVPDAQGEFQVPKDKRIAMRIPRKLLPKTQEGKEVTLNLRADDFFVEDDGWHRASAAYADFIRRHERLHVLYLEMGVGTNTPVIIKYPFWQMTASNQKAVYACLNYREAYCPKEIEHQSLCIDGDIGEVLDRLMQ